MATAGTNVPSSAARSVADPPSAYYATGATAWTGWIGFAGIMLILIGCFHGIAGIVGIFKDGYYALPKKQLLVSVDYTAWGWVHLFLGAAIAVAGIGVMLTGARWARWIGIVLAGLGMIASFMWLPYFPLWAVITLAIDVFIIWALCAGMGTRSQAST